MIVKYDILSLITKFEITYKRLSEKYPVFLASVKKLKHDDQSVNNSLDKNIKSKELINSAEILELNSDDIKSGKSSPPKTTSNITFKKKKKYVRKSPDDKASKYEVGFKMKSTNGNKVWWIVYETKSGHKRWKKHHWIN